jgi:hypothetical protein
MGAGIGSADSQRVVTNAIQAGFEFNVSAKYGSNYPSHGYSDVAAFWMDFTDTRVQS